MSERPAKGRTATQVKFALVLIVVVLLLIVIFQNVENTQYRVLFWTPEMPRFLLPVISLVVGMASGAALLHFLRRRRR